MCCTGGLNGVCVTCTPSPDLLCALALPPRATTTRGKTTLWAVGSLRYGKHCADPSLAPRGVRKTKRARPDAAEECAECDDEE